MLLGLALLGFTSVYREGFEIVIFLQNLRELYGSSVVLEGVVIGCLFTGAAGVLTFALHQRLPYKRLLIITGMMLLFVLVVSVGEEVNEMQLAGWIGTTEINGLRIPGWMGTWFSLFNNWETFIGQGIAVALVLGSYVGAQYVRVWRPRRRGLQAAEDRRPPARAAGGRPRAAHSCRRRVGVAAGPTPARRGARWPLPWLASTPGTRGTEAPRARPSGGVPTRADDPQKYPQRRHCALGGAAHQLGVLGDRDLLSRPRARRRGVGTQTLGHLLGPSATSMRRASTSIVSSSPSRSAAIGPPLHASGTTCATMKPCVAPLKRPSVTSATLSANPSPTIAPVTPNISRIPGPPRGPS